MLSWSRPSVTGKVGPSNGDVHRSKQPPTAPLEASRFVQPTTISELNSRRLESTLSLLLQSVNTLGMRIEDSTRH